MYPLATEWWQLFLSKPKHSPTWKWMQEPQWLLPASLALEKDINVHWNKHTYKSRMQHPINWQVRIWNIIMGKAQLGWMLLARLALGQDVGRTMSLVASLALGRSIWVRPLQLHAWITLNEMSEFGQYKKNRYPIVFLLSVQWQSTGMGTVHYIQLWVPDQLLH